MSEIHDHSHDDDAPEECGKISKIKFDINLLPSIGEYKIEDPDNKG